MKQFLLYFTAIVCIAFQSNAQEHYLLHCGKMVDVTHGNVRENVSILVQGDTIYSITDGFSEADSNQIIVDLSEMTVLPGLMDMHVHVESQTSAAGYLEKFTLNEADIAYRAQQYAKTTLMAGFTTVRDLGGSGVNIALRDAIRNGRVEGPRIYTAGKSLAVTGGHADPTNGYKRVLMGDPGPAEGVVNSAEDGKKAVRHNLKMGADLIKITATGGVLSVAKDGSAPQFSEDEIRAIIETATDMGVHVAAHAHGAEGMKRAIRAGITSIEHGTLMDDEVIALMVEHGTYYVPTITAGKTVADSAKVPGYYPELVVPKALAIGPQLQTTFGKAYAAGVKIAFGTDAGVFTHGLNAKEFGFMVEAGMPAMEAIQSATVTTADLLQMKDKLGSLEAGKLADIIAVAEDPVKNIRTLEEVLFVMKEGKIYKSPKGN